MNFIDKAIKAISPERALKREVAKKRLSMINSGYGNYGASATKKSLIGWTHGGGSHREDVEDNIDPLRQRSRDLFYGGSNVATGAIKRLRTNTIGIGLHLKASINEEVLKIEPEEARELEETIEREFAHWADSTNCDLEAEVLAAVINGLFTVFIEKESASDDVPFGESIPEEMQVDQEDENSIELAPGAVIDLGEGEKANMVNPGRPNPNFDPFVIAVLKQIGAALEIPYEILIMAFSSNYSASRAAILEFFKVVKMYRAWFVADFCQPIYEEWLSEAVAKGRIKAPGFFTDPIIKDAYCSAEWTGPSAGQLDPTKEVEAAEKRVQGGYSTREREARELTGTDFYKNIKQRKREEELLKEVTGGAKTDTQTVENINGREESDTENNPDNDGGQTEEETEE